MARIRTIKPEFWTDEKVMACSIPARLLFIGLLNFADDYGNIQNLPLQIKVKIFPMDDFKPDKLITELVKVNLITEYTVNGTKYLHINNFVKHQYVLKRYKACPDFTHKV